MVGGSIRFTPVLCKSRCLTYLVSPPEEAQSQFGFLWRLRLRLPTTWRFGARSEIVWSALSLAKEPNIREVIAFLECASWGGYLHPSPSHVASVNFKSCSLQVEADSRKMPLTECVLSGIFALAHVCVWSSILRIMAADSFNATLGRRSRVWQPMRS